MKTLGVPAAAASQHRSLLRDPMLKRMKKVGRHHQNQKGKSLAAPAAKTRRAVAAAIASLATKCLMMQRLYGERVVCTECCVLEEQHGVCLKMLLDPTHAY
jgi:hypothetical protein